MRIVKWLAVVVLVVVVVLASLYLRAVKKMKGPPVPVCSLPAPAPSKRTFDAPTQLSSRSTPGARRYDIEPAAALLADGTLAFAFNTRDSVISGTSGLVTGVFAPDGKVELRDYPTDRKQAFDAWMSSAPDGKLRMVWLGHDGGRPEKNMKVAYAESADGRAWSPPTKAHVAADCPDGQRGCMDKPMITGAGEMVYVAYYSTPGEGLRIAGTSAASAPGFDSSLRVGDGAYGDLVATSSAVHVVWVGDAVEKPTPAAEAEGDDFGWDPYGDPRGAIRYARSEDHGHNFSAPVTVSAPGEPIPFYFSNAHVQADEARGLVYVVYPTGKPDGAWSIQLATSRDRGQTWTRVQVNDDAPCASHMTPHAALDPHTGTLHVTWLENRTGHGALAYAACEPGGARCGPNEHVSATPFASYSFERHLPAWLSEYGVLLVDAEHRVLHALWTQPVLEDGEPTSRIFHARARLGD